MFYRLYINGIVITEHEGWGKEVENCILSSVKDYDEFRVYLRLYTDIGKDEVDSVFQLALGEVKDFLTRGKSIRTRYKATEKALIFEGYTGCNGDMWGIVICVLVISMITLLEGK